MSSYDDVLADIRRFRDERDWMQFHSPKNLASSLMIEAAELLEHFQWCTTEESHKIVVEKRTAVSHEMADVAVYLFELADVSGIDLFAAIKEKMALNAAKYPVSKAKGSSAKYTELETPDSP
jgi:NTP pyrophosphatase (non-canonical NTP hydrolase)